MKSTSWKNKWRTHICYTSNYYDGDDDDGDVDDCDDMMMMMIVTMMVMMMVATMVMNIYYFLLLMGVADQIDQVTNVLGLSSPSPNIEMIKM